MPSRLKRYYGANDLHFITCSGYQRRPLFDTPERRDLLLEVLEQVRRRYVLVVLGYVVMPEHMHQLITEPQMGTVSTVMQALKIGFARRVLFSHPCSHFSQSTRENGAPRDGATSRDVISGRSAFMTSMSGLTENGLRNFATFIATR